MFTRIARAIIRYRRLVLVGALGVLVASIAIGGTVADRLDEGGFDDPSSDSVRARVELEERFGQGATDLVAVVTPTALGATVNDPDVVSEAVRLTREIAAIDGTDDVVSYWTVSDDSLRSEARDRGLVLIRVPGAPDDHERQTIIAEIVETYSDLDLGSIQVDIGGREAVFERMGDVVEEDLAVAEAIAVPVTFIVLVLIFGGVVAASLPVGVGMFAALGTFVVLRVVDSMTNVSIFALNLVTALGLGLAIDYSLLVVSRYREERVATTDHRDALIRTVETAGRTIAFSGLTVAISLGALLVFPLTFLRSFAYAGIGVVAFAMAASIVVLPAAIAALGPRIDAWPVYRHRAGRHAANPWKRLGERMAARPWPIILLAIPLLALTAAPFLGVEWGEADDRALAPGDPVREVSDMLREEFGSAEANAFPIVIIDPNPSRSITPFALAVSMLDGVGRVDTVTGSFAQGASIVPPGPGAAIFATSDSAWFRVVPSVEPISPEGEALIAAIRSLDSPFAETYVGGGTAALVDTKSAIIDRAWLAALWIMGATFVLLFTMFRSVLVPLKAIALNMLSLGATFGMVVWVFQEGHGADLLDITPTGQTDITTPILMFCIAFGLSMDYEVFLLARMKEEYDESHDNRAAVIAGLAGTGRLVTQAAVLLSITFVAFALTANVSTIKLFGLGLAVAVLVDAFIVRVTLVPALMVVAGRLNWWAPRVFRHGRHRRSGSASTRTEQLLDLRREIDLRAGIEVGERAPETARVD